MAYLHNDRYDVTIKAIPVRLKRDNLVENGRLVYTAWVEKREEETGEASTWDHIVDNRECRWTLSAHMSRSYFVQSILGIDNPMPASTLSIPLHVNGASNGLASFFDHDPCSNYRGQIDQGVDDLKDKMASAFDQYMNEDLAKFKTEQQGVTVEINA